MVDTVNGNTWLILSVAAGEHVHPTHNKQAQPSLCCRAHAGSATQAQQQQDQLAALVEMSVWYVWYIQAQLANL